MSVWSCEEHVRSSQNQVKSIEKFRRDLATIGGQFAHRAFVQPDIVFGTTRVFRAAQFLSKRIQTAPVASGRAPDMSPAAAAAMRTVLHAIDEEARA